MDLAKNPLCPIFLPLFVLAAFSAPVEAATSRFDARTLVLEIPCVEVTQSGEQSVNYSLSLKFNGKTFDLVELQEANGGGDCSANFDMENEILVDQVRYVDYIYDVQLIHIGNLEFSPGKISFLGVGESSLWRVSNGETELFIGGTIHILNIKDIPPPNIFTEAYFLADLLVTEISYADLQGEDNDMAREFTMNPDGRLSENLMPETLEALEAFLEELGLSIEPVDELLPYWAGQALIQLKLASLGYGPGVDFFYMLFADIQGKENIGLETSISQVTAINSVSGIASENSPDEVILSAIETADSDEYPAAIDRLIAAWREGDVEFISEVNKASKEADPDAYEIIFSNRNMAWIPQIESMLLTEEVELVLVGVGHLAGDDNVLSLLEELGYTVERYHSAFSP